MLFRIKVVVEKHSRFGVNSNTACRMCRVGAQLGAGVLRFFRKQICFDWVKAVQLTLRALRALRDTAVAMQGN